MDGAVVRGEVECRLSSFAGNDAYFTAGDGVCGMYEISVFAFWIGKEKMAIVRRKD